MPLTKKYLKKRLAKSKNKKTPRKRVIKSKFRTKKRQRRKRNIKTRKGGGRVQKMFVAAKKRFKNLGKKKEEPLGVVNPNYVNTPVKNNNSLYPFSPVSSPISTSTSTSTGAINPMFFTDLLSHNSPSNSPQYEPVSPLEGDNITEDDSSKYQAPHPYDSTTYENHKELGVPIGSDTKHNKWFMKVRQPKGLKHSVTFKDKNDNEYKLISHDYSLDVYTDDNNNDESSETTLCKKKIFKTLKTADNITITGLCIRFGTKERCEKMLDDYLNDKLKFKKFEEKNNNWGYFAESKNDLYDILNGNGNENVENTYSHLHGI